MNKKTFILFMFMIIIWFHPTNDLIINTLMTSCWFAVFIFTHFFSRTYRVTFCEAHFDPYCSAQWPWSKPEVNLKCTNLKLEMNGRIKSALDQKDNDPSWIHHSHLFSVTAPLSSHPSLPIIVPIPLYLYSLAYLWPSLCYIQHLFFFIFHISPIQHFHKLVLISNKAGRRASYLLSLVSCVHVYTTFIF